MQALLVVDVRDEAVDAATGVVEVCKCLAVDLFGLERLHEAFGLGVVEGIAGPAHADGDVLIRQPLAISDGSVLDAAIGVMNQAAGWWSSGVKSLIERGDCERGIERV